MVTYKTEEERVKQIQDFFSDYKYSILITLFIFGVSLGSYFFLQNFFKNFKCNEKFMISYLKNFLTFLSGSGV